MPSVLHTGSPVKGATFLCTPVGGDVIPHFAFALFESAKKLTELGIPTHLELYTENCHVDDGRNRLVRDFLETGCEQLIFIDPDVRWEANDLAKLIKHDREVVAGIYPLKQVEESYPVRLKPGEIWADKDGLIEVEGVPTGFLKIKRSVLEKLAEGAPCFPAKDDVKGKRMIPIIFERTHSGNTRWGGDYTFCEKWRATGGKIYIDPEMRLEHYGQKAWSGTYGQFLKRKMGLGVLPMLQSISKGAETTQTIIDLVEQWGNPMFQASPEFLYKCILEARQSKGDIVECGTGMTTLAMAVSTKNIVYAIEHDPIWATHLQKEAERYGIKNIKIIYAPIKNNWYGVDSLPESTLIVCDGPPRSDATRSGLKGFITSPVKILFDDYDDLSAWGSDFEIFGASRLCAVMNYTPVKEVA